MNAASYDHFIKRLKDAPGKYVTGFNIKIGGKPKRTFKVVDQAAALRFAHTWGLEMPG